MDNNGSTMKILKIIASEILTEMAKGTNISTVIHKNQIISLLNQMKQNQYYIIHSLLDGSNTSIIIKRFDKNEQCIIKLSLFTLDDVCNFNIELYKFGQTMTKSLVKRYAVLTKKNFYSSLNPISSFDHNKAKSKLAFLEQAHLHRETFDYNSKQLNWTNSNRNHRVDIVYKDYQKVDQHFYLYFINEKEMDIGFTMALTHTQHKTTLISSVNNIQDSIIMSYLSYSMIKLIAVKNKIKQKKNAIGLFRNIIKTDYAMFNKFAIKVEKNIKQKTDNQKDYRLFPSLKFILIPLSSVYSTRERIAKKDMTSCQYALDVIKQHVLIKRKLFSVKTNDKKKQKCFAFNLIPNSFKFISAKAKETSIKPTQVTMNKTQISVDFNTNLSLPLEKIIHISNVIMNISHTETKPEQNGIMIYGPKIDNNQFLSFNYNDRPDEVYYEPEIARLNYIGFRTLKNPNTLVEVYLMQIFHAVLSFDYIAGLLKLKSNNCIKDYKFYIEFTFDKTQKARSELIYPVLYSNNKIVLEFNKEFYINKYLVNSFFEIKIEICMIPVDTLSESNYFNHKFILNYISPVRLAHTLITFEDIRLKRNEYELSSGDNSRIMINCQLSEVQGETINYLQFKGKEYSIGSDIYYHEQLTPNIIDKLNSNSSIPKLIKKEYYDISKSHDGLFLSRPNENIDYSMLQSKTKSTDEINGIQHNNKYSYIPICQLNSDNAFLYKNKYIDVMALSDFKGVDIKGNLLIKNYFTYEDKIIAHTEKNTNSLYCIQENMFNVINYNAISVKHITNLNNYQWKIYLKFYNEYETEAFISFLKKIRREASLAYYSSHINDNPIDFSRFIAYQNKVIHSDIKILSISFEKIEFKNTFNLIEDVRLIIKFKKNIVQSKNRHILGKSLIESFNENPEINYTNSLLQRSDMLSLYKSVKELKNVSKALSRQFDLIKDHFNSDHKYIDFSKVHSYDKTIVMQINFTLEKIFTIEIILEGQNKQIVFISNIDLDNIIRDNANADYYYLPLYPSSTKKNVIGIICIKLLCVYKDKENTIFDEEYKLTIEKALNKKEYLREENLNKITLSYYEPNILRRLMMIKFNNQFNESFNTLIDQLSSLPIGSDLRLQCYEFMRDKFIRDCDDILKLNNLTDSNINDLVLDDYPRINRRKIACLKKYYINKKRNQIISLYTLIEWEVVLNKYMTYQKKTINSNLKSIFDNFPSKNQILEIESSNRTLFNDIQNLVLMGLPTQESRRLVWNSLLEIDLLVKLTSHKLPGYDNGNKSTTIMKGEIYSYFDRVVKSKKQLSIIDSLIDNDSNLLASNNSNCNAYIDLNQIKTISKSFYLWTELSISINNLKELKYVYFKGLLRIIQRFYNIFQSSSETFWYIIGLSQVIQLFNQPNPLFSSELNYIGQYTLVTKLILESHYKRIFNKFNELSFPIDYFITKHFSTFYSDYFQTDLFLKLYDIIIFQSAIKPNKDSLRYLRFLCVIPIILFQLNEKIILMAKSVNELDNVFVIFFTKTYNSNKFIEMITETIEKYFYQKNILDSFFPINKSNSWDLKRNEIEKALSSHFNNVLSENKRYLKKIMETNKTVTIFPNALFENNYLQAIQEKTTKNKTNERINLSMDNNDNIRNGVIYQLKRLFILKYSSSLCDSFMSSNEFYYQTIYSNTILTINEMSLSNKRVKLTVDNNSNILSLKTVNESINGFTQYMMILLLNTSLKPVCRFCIHFNKIPKVPQSLQIESIDIEENSPKIILNIAIMKYMNKKDRENEDLLQMLFSKPYYSSNELIVSLFTSDTLTFHDYIKECLFELEPIVKSSNEEIKLLCDKLSVYSLNKENMSNYCINRQRISLSRSNAKVIEEILNSFVDKDISSIATEWLRSSKIVSLEEILFAVILIDKDIISIDDKLQFIYKIAKVKCLFENDNDKSATVSVKELKEIIYSLYKRYMIYFSKEETDTMVDYLMKHEKMNTIKYVIAYNQCNNKEIEDIVSDKSVSLNSHSIQLFHIEKIDNSYYEDITNQFICLIQNIQVKFGVSSFNQEIIQIMLSNIMMSHTDFENRKIDYIRIEYVNDYIRDKLIYQYNFETKKVEMKTKYPTYNLNTNDELMLLQSTDTLNICSTYCDDNTVSLTQFKKIIFDLPYLSDLMRVSCSYSEPKVIQEDYIQCFAIVKISIMMNYSLLMDVLFSNETLNLNVCSTSSSCLHIDYSVSPLNTMRDLREMIKNKLLYVTVIDNQDELMHYFEDTSICNYFIKNSQLNSKEKIQLNDALYLKILMNQRPKRIEIIYEINTVKSLNNNHDIDETSNGYAKYYYNKNDKTKFEWRKCKIEIINDSKNNRDPIHQYKVYFTCFNYQTPIRMKSSEVIQFDYMIR